MSVHKSGQRLAVLGICSNVVLAVVKIGAGVVGNAYALIADGVESMADVGASIVIWSGLKLAAKPPDDEHPLHAGLSQLVL